jgi:hypothetical protein
MNANEVGLDDYSDVVSRRDITEIRYLHPMNAYRNS